MTDTANTLPSPPWNMIAVLLGAENSEPPRLVQFMYYPYAVGLSRLDEAWVTGSEVDELLDSGALLEILSSNSKDVLALDDRPGAESNLPTVDVTDETEDSRRDPRDVPAPEQLGGS
jgi:hypothetical protein